MFRNDANSRKLTGAHAPQNKVQKTAHDEPNDNGHTRG
jgi:pyrroloquinoline quinone biosynthesis protein E